MAEADDCNHLAIERRRDRFGRTAILRSGNRARFIDARRRGRAS